MDLFNKILLFIPMNVILVGKNKERHEERHKPRMCLLNGFNETLRRSDLKGNQDLISVIILL